MGFFPYTQMCVHGHKWGAYFASYNMTSTHQNSCPECGCTRLGRYEGGRFTEKLIWDPEEIEYEGICKHVNNYETVKKKEPPP